MTKYAVIQTGGKQYKVQEGDRISIEKLEVEPGSPLTFDQVLLVRDDAGVKVGTPFLANATVKGKVAAQRRDRKVIIFKFRRRMSYHRTAGHRQSLTDVVVEAIQSR